MTARRPTPPIRPNIVRRPIVDPDGVALLVGVHVGESPLAWLARRRDRDGAPLIDSGQFAAGERLRADFTRARLGGLVSNWRDGERISGGRPDETLSDASLAARRRVTAALSAVGPELAGVLIDVCCSLKGLEQVEMERRWPPRAGKVVLKMALDRLKAHYGPEAVAAGPARAAARHWRSPDTPEPDRAP